MRLETKATEEGISDVRHVKSELYKLADWWVNHGFDAQAQSFYTEVDNNNIPVEADYVIIQRSRLLWFFSSLNDSNYKQYADNLYEELITHFYDSEHKGFYWSLDKDYKVLRAVKQSYAQAFCVYALCAYYKFSGREEARQLAVETVEAMEQHCRDRVHGGYMEALSQKWQALEDVRLSSKDQNDPKTMNTHLHILEAYTAFHKMQSNQYSETILEEVYRLYISKFIDKKTARLQLFFSLDWKLNSDIISFGHEIESAWLLYKAAQALNHPADLVEAKQLMLDIADSVAKDGIDGHNLIKDEVHNGKLEEGYTWWCQAEAIVGYIYAFSMSKKERYYDLAQNIYLETMKVFKDSTHGEWYWKVNADKAPSQGMTKSNAWKAPYHNGRMYLELIKFSEKNV